MFCRIIRASLVISFCLMLVLAATGDEPLAIVCGTIFMVLFVVMMMKGCDHDHDE